MIGAWSAHGSRGTLADRIGRVRVMQLAAALFVFSALFTGLASNIWVFVIFRIVGGLGVGFTSAIGPAYISDDIAVVTPRIPHRLPTDGHRLGHRGLPCGQ